MANETFSNKIMFSRGEQNVVIQPNIKLFVFHWDLFLRLDSLTTFDEYIFTVGASNIAKL